MVNKRARTGVAVYVITLVAAVLWGWRILTGSTLFLDSSQMSLVPRLLLYGAFAVTLWAAFQVFDVLFPHAFHLQAGFWTKAIWLVLLAIWPIGPLLYYLAVYRSSEAERTAAIQ